MTQTIKINTCRPGSSTAKRVTATNATLVVVCKRPALGWSKQRLARQIGAQHALQIAQQLLHCALADARQWQQQTSGQVAIAPASGADRRWAEELLPGALVVPQQEGNLGTRLRQIDQQLTINGHPQKLFIGTDSPGLRNADLLLAERQLMDHDVVLKPAADGGVTLMANRKPWPALHSLPWSSADLQNRLSACCLTAGYTVRLMQQGEDVDEWNDLLQQQDVLRQDSRRSRQQLLQCLDDVTAALANPSIQETTDSHEKE